MESSPTFFEGVRLNYGSNRAAGQALGISPNLLEKYSKAERGRKIPNREIARMEKALNKLPLSKRNTSLAYIYSSGNATPAQRRFMLEYAKKGEKQRRYIRKAINDAAGQQKRVLMPALTAGGKITNSPPIKKTTPEGSQQFTAKETKKFIAQQKRDIAKMKRERKREGSYSPAQEFNTKELRKLRAYAKAEAARVRRENKRAIRRARRGSNKR